MAWAANRDVKVKMAKMCHLFFFLVFTPCSNSPSIEYSGAFSAASWPLYLFPGDPALPPSFPVHPSHLLCLWRVCSARCPFRKELINSLMCNSLGLFAFLGKINDLTGWLSLHPSLFKVIKEKTISKQKVKVTPVEFSAIGK